MSKEKPKKSTSQSNWCHVPLDATVPLVPSFREDEHRIYANKLLSLVKNPAIRNIALSGPFGSGKSSVIAGCMEEEDFRKEAVLLSIPYFPGLTDDSQQEQIPEKEILTQLIYSVDPSQLPDSKLNRIGNNHRIFAALLSLIVSVALGYLLNQYLSKPVEFDNLLNIPFTISTFLRSVLGGIFLLVVWLFLYKFVSWTFRAVTVMEIKAGPVSLSLNSKDESYFDKYLDEIAYFFKKTKKRIVVFEDLDRYESFDVFSKLRHLNLILNANIQEDNSWLARVGINTNKRKLPIVFVYAVKDSIFAAESTDIEKRISQAETRTKFFDFIIPVIPFVSPLSSRGALIEQLKRVGFPLEIIEGAKSSDNDLANKQETFKRLVAVATPYLTQPRVILNICNDYAFYSCKLFHSKTYGSGLSELELIALLIYKAFHFEDFEKLTLGRSNLDLFFNSKTEFLTKARIKLEASILSPEKWPKLTDVLDAPDENLIDILDRFVYYNTPGHTIQAIKIRGIKYLREDLSSIKFLKALSTLEKQNSIKLYWNESSYQEFTIEGIRELSDWRSESGLAGIIEKYEQQQQAKFDQLIGIVETLASQGYVKETLHHDEYYELLSEYNDFIDKCFTSDIARNIVKTGAISEACTLYANATAETNLPRLGSVFYLRNYRNDLPNPSMVLSTSDVKFLLTITGGALWSKRCALNTSLIIEAVASQDESVKLQLQSTIHKYPDEMTDLANSLLANTPQLRDHEVENFFNAVGWLSSFVSEIAAIIPRMLDTFKDKNVFRNALLEAIFRHLQINSSELFKVLDEEARETFCQAIIDWRQETKDKTDVLFTPKYDEEFETTRETDSFEFVYLLKLLNCRIVDFSIFPTDFIFPWAFYEKLGEPNKNNFEYIFRHFETVSLNEIIEQGNSVIIGFLLSSIDTLVSVTKEYTKPKTPVLITSLTNDILKQIHIFENIKKILETLLEYSAVKKFSLSHQDFKTGYWPLLASCKLIEPSFSFIHQYKTEFEWDEDITAFLGDVTTILDSSKEHSSNRDELRLELLNLEALGDYKKRITLVKGLKASDSLALDKINNLDFNYAYECWKANLISDDTIREYAFENAEMSQIAGVLNELNAPFQDLDWSSIDSKILFELLIEKSLDGQVKQDLLNESYSYFPNDLSPDEVEQISKTITENNLNISAEPLLHFARSYGVSSSYLNLLIPRCSVFTETQLLEILEMSPAPFNELTSLTGKRLRISKSVHPSPLLDCLQKLGYVSTIVNEGQNIRVNLKRKKNT